jgi:hypothetical protein
VPIQFSDSLYANSNLADTSSRISINKISKLILFNDSTGNYHAEVVSGFPDTTFIKKKANNFSGVAYVQDWQGNFLRAYRFRDSQVFSLAPQVDLLVQKKETTESLRGTDYMEPDCTEIDWYSCTGTEDDPYQYCRYDFTQDLGCGTVSGGGGGGSVGPITSTDYGYISGGGAGGSSGWNSINTTLCANYNFTSVGNSFTGTIVNLSWQYGNSTTSYTVSFAQSCLTIPNYNINAAQASVYFNSAFNSATNEVLLELGAGTLTPILVQTRLKTLINSYLNILKPGAIWTATGACSGNVASTTINKNSYCN